MRLDALAPVIETERLRLRGRTLDDFAFFVSMWADPAVTRHIGGTPRSEEDTWTKFLRMIGHWAALGFGYWVVEEKDTGRAVGEAGFGRFKRVIEPSLHDAPEMGWALAPAAQGRGYATEAVRAAIAWGDGFFDAARLSCIIGKDNAASVRVAEKVGFARSGLARYHDEDVLLFYRDRAGANGQSR